MTKDKFNNHHMLLNIEIVVNQNLREINIDKLSNVVVTGENIAYIIFTSGSTGIPKAVRMSFLSILPKLYSFMF